MIEFKTGLSKDVPIYREKRWLTPEDVIKTLQKMKEKERKKSDIKSETK